MEARRRFLPPRFWRIPLGAWAGDPCFILGGGPSLKGFDVPRLKGRGRVIAVNNAGLDLCPWADVLYFADGDQRWWGWNKDRIGLFQGEWLVTRADLKDPPAQLLRVRHNREDPLSTDGWHLSGVCGGANAINLAFCLGASPIILMGFDMRPGNWHNLHKLPPKAGQHRQRFIPAIEAMRVAMGDHVVLNASPGSALRCWPVVDIEEVLAVEDLAKIEADKYRRVWERPEYRRVSPGMLEAERAFAVLEMQAGQSLTDFGAGTGRATAWFQDRGLKVLALDLVTNALETRVPFLQQNLWAMTADVPVSDLGFCCDVLEHIPPNRVERVLAGIRSKVSGAVYFRIATRPDRMGRLIGTPLHLSVKSGEWWRRQLEGFWECVDVVSMDGRDAIFVARPA